MPDLIKKGKNRESVLRYVEKEKLMICRGSTIERDSGDESLAVSNSQVGGGRRTRLAWSLWQVLKKKRKN